MSSPVLMNGMTASTRNDKVVSIGLINIQRVTRAKDPGTF